MAFVAPYPLTGFQVPGCEGHVCGGGEDEVGVTGPVEVEEGAFVAGELAVVLAGAVGAPEEDGAVH